MREKEAIQEIQRLCCNENQYYVKGERKCKDNCMYGEDYCAFQIAIKALEDIQKYRELGTLEQVQQLKEHDTAKKDITVAGTEHVMSRFMKVE